MTTLVRRLSISRSVSPSMGLSTALAAGLALTLLASAASATVGNLYVTEEGPGNVWNFNGVTGAPVSFFNPSPLSGNLMGIHTGGAAGDVLVGTGFGGVHRLDRNTGAVVQTYNPTGGWQWAGLWRPTSNTVLIGSHNTDDLREYDATTGAYIGTFATGISNPADMIYGPNGNIFAASFDPTGGIFEIDGLTGAVLGHYAVGMAFTNDIVFMPDGRRIVTVMGDNTAKVYDSSWNLVASFAGTGWGRIHGITVSPHDGLIYAVDGMTTNVHAFDPVTYAEVDPNFSSTNTKPVDLEFRPAIPTPGAAGLLIACGAVASRRRRS